MKRYTVTAFLALLLFTLFSFPSAALYDYFFASSAELYVDGVTGVELPYRLAVNMKAQEYNLVLFLHGSGERGTDNEKQAMYNTVIFDRMLLRDEPFVMIAPQTAANWVDGEKDIDMSAVLTRLVKSVEKKYKASHRSVIGLSMGGCGVWNMVAKQDGFFDAAVPVCGYGDPALLSGSKETVVWAFHGDADETVSVEESRALTAALNEAGGSAKLTEYEGVGHNSWDRAWREPDLIPWMLGQRAVRPPEPADNTLYIIIACIVLIPAAVSVPVLLRLQRKKTEGASIK